MSAPKAYMVTETTEGTGGIVYAKSNAQARREGSCEFGDGDFHGYECRRAPEFDSLWPKGPTREDLFEHGWWFDCEECSRRATQDGGGIVVVGQFYCGDHADFYAWRTPDTWRSYWRPNDYVWEPPSRWSAPPPAVAEQTVEEG